MPRFCLETNVPLKEIPEEFLTTCIQTLSKMLGKPEPFVVAFVTPNQDMSFGNSDEPCGIVSISCIGLLGVEDNRKLCNVFFKLVEEYVGIPRKRLWFTFTETLPEAVTFRGTTFYHLIMCRDPGAPMVLNADD